MGNAVCRLQLPQAWWFMVLPSGSPALTRRDFARVSKKTSVTVTHPEDSQRLLTAASFNYVGRKVFTSPRCDNTSEAQANKNMLTSV